MNQPFLPQRLQWIKRITGITLREARERMNSFLNTSAVEYPIDRWYLADSNGPKNPAEAEALAHAFGVDVSFFYYRRLNVTLTNSRQLLIEVLETANIFTVYLNNNEL